MILISFIRLYHGPIALLGGLFWFSGELALTTVVDVCDVFMLSLRKAQLRTCMKTY